MIVTGDDDYNCDYNGDSYGYRHGDDDDCDNVR